MILFSAAGSDQADLDRGADRRWPRGTTRFTLRHGAEEVTVRSKLLGRHNVANLLAAAAVGTALDLPLDAIEARPRRASRRPPTGSRRSSTARPGSWSSTTPTTRTRWAPPRARGPRRARGGPPAARDAGHGRAGRPRGRGERVVRRARRGRLRSRGAGGGGALEADPGRPRRPPPPDDRVHVVANSSEAEALLAKTTRRGDVVLFENDLSGLYAEDSNGSSVSAPSDAARVRQGRRPVPRPIRRARQPPIISAQQLMAVHGAEPRADPGLPRPRRPLVDRRRAARHRRIRRGMSPRPQEPCELGSARDGAPFSAPGPHPLQGRPRSAGRRGDQRDPRDRRRGRQPAGRR